MGYDRRMRKLFLLVLTFAIPLAEAKAEDYAIGSTNVVRVLWYHSHPDATTAKLKWCVAHSRGDPDCEAATRACGDILRENPKATCQTAMAR
jgi:hypothetical protein